MTVRWKYLVKQEQDREAACKPNQRLQAALLWLCLHGHDLGAELLHFVPIGEFDVGLGVGFAFVDFHPQLH